MKKRRHHYVWRKYLKSWASNDSIWCLRNGKVFNTNLMGVGQQRDFYKLKKLTSIDIEFIKKIAIEPSNKNLKSSNEGWLEMFRLVELLKVFVEINGFSHPEIEKLLDEAEHNFEEDFHSLIENEAIQSIDAILNEDISFYSEERRCLDFSFFICMQYMRTNKIQMNFLHEFRSIKHVNLESCWSIIRHIFATNVSWVLFADRHIFKIHLVVNNSSVPFITGDQPVINTYAVGRGNRDTINELELYYPVSPRLAIIISGREEYKEQSVLNISKGKVVEFNNMIVESSHEQIYAETREILESYL